MVTGEMDFDGLFNLGVPPSEYTPIPFHITNFIMWIVFLILIPIVLGNMLVSTIMSMMPRLSWSTVYTFLNILCNLHENA